MGSQSLTDQKALLFDWLNQIYLSPHITALWNTELNSSISNCTTMNGTALHHGVIKCKPEWVFFFAFEIGKIHVE